MAPFSSPVQVCLSNFDIERSVPVLDFVDTIVAMRKGMMAIEIVPNEKSEAWFTALNVSFTS